MSVLITKNTAYRAWAQFLQSQSSVPVCLQEQCLQALRLHALHTMWVRNSKDSERLQTQQLWGITSSTFPFTTESSMLTVLSSRTDLQIPCSSTSNTPKSRLGKTYWARKPYQSILGSRSIRGVAQVCTRHTCASPRVGKLVGKLRSISPLVGATLQPFQVKSSIVCNS